jgi:hypothetical protein
MRAVALTVVALWTSGCAAIFNGTTETVRINTLPPGADVSVNGNYLGQGPIDVQVKRQSSTAVQVTKDGYQPGSVLVEHHAEAGWFLWDITTCIIPVTLCIPVIVDAVSGAWFGIDDEYAVKLQPLPKPPPVVQPAPVPESPAVTPSAMQ